jgi:hypothetical protein
LQNFSPGKHVPFDHRSRGALNRLVRRTRSEIMTSQVPCPGIKLDGSEGSMNQLIESLSLVKFIERHNDPTDSFHMTEHQVVSVGHQFSDGVNFMCAHDTASAGQYGACSQLLQSKTGVARNLCWLGSV